MRLVPFKALAIGLSLAVAGTARNADDKGDEANHLQGVWVVDPAT